MSFIDLAVQGSNAPAPTSNYLRIFVKSDGVYVEDSTGVVTGPIVQFPLNFPAATELTIAAGIITVTGSHHKIDTESDTASDDLDTITAATSPASNLLIIRSENDARSVVVKHNVGNIFFSGGADITLDDLTDHLLLFYDGTQWVNLQ